MHSMKLTFLVTYSLGVLADDTDSAIDEIDKWLGKPVVITCNEVTAVQLPQVLEWIMSWHYWSGRINKCLTCWT